MTRPNDLAERIAAATPLLAQIARREAGTSLLRFETIDDLVLGMQQEALRSLPQLDWKGADAFDGWLSQIARRHLGARRDYWFALKRRGGAILRLTQSGEVHAANPGPGSRTIAQRREDLAAVRKAMDLLPERDRDLLTWTAEGIPFEEQGLRLGIASDAARKASSRAVERMRKLIEVVRSKEKSP